MFMYKCTTALYCFVFVGRYINAYISIIVLLLTDSVYLFLQSGLTHQEKEKFGHLSRWFDNVSVTLFKCSGLNKHYQSYRRALGDLFLVSMLNFCFVFPFQIQSLEGVLKHQPRAYFIKNLIYAGVQC